MSWLGVLLPVAGVLAAVSGFRRSRYDGLPPRVWWEQERMHRTPARILGRHARVWCGAALLVGSAVVALLLLGLLLSALVALAALAWLWWRLRCAARAAAPRRMPFEDDDLDMEV